MNDIKTSQLYQATMRQALAMIAGQHQALWHSDLFLRGCESQLEAAWRIWWNLAATSRTVNVPKERPQHVVTIGGQTYRLDVALFRWGSDVPVLAIELDGHTYHERTREQVAERNARDRALQTAGWTVLHFSYQEITSCGMECAVEALERFDALVARTERIA